MFDITTPSKAGFKRGRGRPKNRHFIGSTPELQQKHRRIREVLTDNKSPLILSWLHIARHQNIINQDLFDLGEHYLRLRLRVLRHQQRRRLQLSCDALVMPTTHPFSQKRENTDEKAEERWLYLAKNMPPHILNYLDELLLDAIDYDLTAEQAMINKLRLRRYLTCLNGCKDIIY
jgi:hypothetical protein